jgi:tRNA pseudouridine32 synthase / 23S rRNA pseudouridine746 synthase
MMIFSSEGIAARLLYRDALMLVIDKPAGLPVHAGSGGGPNLEMYLDGLRWGLPQPPALAHRLDRDTSGCLVLGRHRKALAKLGELFAGRETEKVYWAVVRGAPPADEGLIELALKKHPQSWGWKMCAVPADEPGGQPAVTGYRVLGQGGGFSWLECRPQTGRTHQLRVHLDAIGCPIVGDTLYGPDAGPPDPAKPTALHLLARAITLPLYPKRAPITVTAEPSPHMVAALQALGH